MRDLYTIRTAENVSFDFELAGLSSRALAWAFDMVLIVSALFALGMLAGIFGIFLGGFAQALYMVAAFLVQWGYGTLTEWAWGGQTLGKRIVGVRVLQSAGTAITFAQAAIRNLARVVDLLPLCYGVGAVAALIDRKGRRLGDLAADTVVVRQRRSPRPSAVMAPVDRYNSFIRDPAVVHASQRVTALEREAMVGLALRRESLPLAVRYALFSRLARHLEQRLGVARPDFFSEERFVLNVTAVVLSGGAEQGAPPGIAAASARGGLS
ncbi:MAG: RDD family protein [Myxococcales bacterium]|nr:RDD family protein [Myxococcales bacterium]